ncbi:hypothetical protein Bca101_021148 [Brassica carinata]
MASALSEDGIIDYTDPEEVRFCIKWLEVSLDRLQQLKSYLSLVEMGFVGSHVCKEALDRGLSVSSLCRSGRSSVQESWASRVTWHQGMVVFAQQSRPNSSCYGSQLLCVFDSVSFVSLG